jgi:hypothetical protein
MNANQITEDSATIEIRRDGETVPLETVLATMECSPGGITEGREVFAADEIRFEDALAVVGNRMQQELSNRKPMDDICFTAQKNFQGGVEFKWRMYAQAEFVYGQTIEETRAQFKTPEQIKADKIAKLRADEQKLRAELLALESEVQS